MLNVKRKKLPNYWSSHELGIGKWLYSNARSCEGGVSMLRSRDLSLAQTKNDLLFLLLL